MDTHTQQDERLSDYTQMIARSMLVWDGYFYGLVHELPPGTVDYKRACQIRDQLKQVRDSLNLSTPDKDLLPEDPQWQALHRALQSLHKDVIHILPNNEFAHRKLREIEQLVRELALEHKRAS